MSGSYDISTVVSRSYISEQVQDNMQKGSEEKSAFFMQEFIKEAEKKNKTVRRADRAENPIISQNRIKEEEKSKKGKKRQKQNRNSVNEDKEKTSSKIDFIV